MPTLVIQTEGDVVEEALRILGDLTEPATLATAGGAGSITLGNVPIDAISANDDHYNNLWAYIKAGVSAGDTRLIKDYTGTTRVADVAPNWTTTPDTTSEVLISRRFRPDLAVDAVRGVIRELAMILPMPLTDTSLRIGSLVNPAGFEYWDGSADVTSGNFIYTRYIDDGWKVNGTSAIAARESTFVRNIGAFTQYAAKIVSNGNNEAFLEFLISNWAQFAGVTCDMEGWVYASAASRVRVRTDDGVTQHVTGDHSATAGWEKLALAGFTINSAMTKLGLQAFIEGTAGGALTVYFDDVAIFPNQFVHTMAIPAPFQYIKELYVESGTEGVFRTPIPKSYWDVLVHDDGRSYIRFDPQLVSADNIPTFETLGGIITRKRRLMIEGQGYRTDLMGTTTNVGITPQLVAVKAAAQLADGKASGESGESRYWTKTAERLHRRADRLQASSPYRRATSSVRV